MTGLPVHSEERLGSILIRSGLLSASQWEEAMREKTNSGNLLGQCLQQLGFLEESEFIEALSSRLGLPIVDFETVEIQSGATKRLSIEFVKQHKVLPFEVLNGSIRVATSEPENRRVQDDIRLLTGLEVEEYLAPSNLIIEKIAEAYQVTVEQMIERFSADGDAVLESGDMHDIEVMANEPTVVNLVNLIISTALKERASDIHLVPFEKDLELRYRIDGILHEKPPPPKKLHAALVSRIKIMADMNIAERFMPQDGHIQINHRGFRVDIRVGTMPTHYGESLVMRLLEKTGRVQAIEELGFDLERARLLSRIVRKPHGLFLTTGPTGSGKTTTLYSILSSIYTPEKKILTIEDPIEYELPGVAQIPVRVSRGFTFAKGLRAILRQDPDVVMVGEIRDSETAEIAIRAALTGHQVFSTLHTNDSAGAVTRLMDMGVEPFLISSSLEGVLAQRLVRRICPDCRMEVEPDEELREKFHTLGVESQFKVLYQGRGCEECRETGYRGRVGLFELLALTTELKEMILQKRTSSEIKSAALSNMISIRQDALNKVKNGVTTIDEVLRVAFGDISE